MDVILSQLSRTQLQTHSVEALHAELQTLEGVFNSAVQTLQRISSVRDTAATFLVDCDDSTTLAHLTRIHALREDAAMRLDLLTAEIHMRRRDAERQARKTTASPAVKPERPLRTAASPMVSPALVIDCMSPLSSPARAPVSPPARIRQAPQTKLILSSPAPLQSPPAYHRSVVPVAQQPAAPDSHTPLRNEIEISDSGSDTESDDEDIPVSALLGREQQHAELQRAAVSTRHAQSSVASQAPSTLSVYESRVEAKTARIAMGVPLPASLSSTPRPGAATVAPQQQPVPTPNEQQQVTANMSKNQLRKLKKKKSRATKKATAGSGAIVHMSVSKPNSAERRRQQFQTQT